MVTFTDVAVIVFLVILAANGAYQGLLRSLVGPVSLLLSLATSVVVYFVTKSFSATFLTTVLSPLFYGWAIVVLIKKFLNPNESPELSMVSRVMGQVVNLVWGSLLVFVAVAFLAFFPFDRFDLAGVSKDVRRSFTYRLVEPVFLNKLIAKATAPAPLTCAADLCSAPEADLQTLSNDPDIQTIMNDPRIQKMMDDPAAQKAIEAQDFSAILGNPAVQELTQDPQFIIKAIKAYPKIQQLKAAADAAASAQDLSK
jgi:hypothetical protein